MDPVVPAPAPTEAPETMPAADAAVAADNYQEFEAAELAKAAGKPLAPVAAVPVSDERPISRVQREANERTRKAVDAATADLQKRIKELEATAAPKTAPVVRTEPLAPAAPPTKAERFQSFQDYVVKNPDATLEDYLEARDEHRDTVAQRTAAQRTEASTEADIETARANRVDAAFAAKAAIDKDFTAKFDPRILQYNTIADSERKGIPVTPGSIILTEMMDSDAFMPLAEHFSAHPEDLTRLETVPERFANMPPRQRAREHTKWIVREMGKLETTLTPAATAAADEPPPPPKLKTVSSAPPPPTEIGRRATTPADPIAAAVKSGDYAAFEQAEFAARRAART